MAYGCLPFLGRGCNVPDFSFNYYIDRYKMLKMIDPARMYMLISVQQYTSQWWSCHLTFFENAKINSLPWISSVSYLHSN